MVQRSYHSQPKWLSAPAHWNTCRVRRWTGTPQYLIDAHEEVSDSLRERFGGEVEYRNNRVLPSSYFQSLGLRFIR